MTATPLQSNTIVRLDQPEAFMSDEEPAASGSVGDEDGGQQSDADAFAGGQADAQYGLLRDTVEQGTEGQRET